MKLIKICGLKRQLDIEYVNKCKPDFVGFIINFPKSHRNLNPEQVKALTEKLDNGIAKVGVFVNQPLELIADLLNSGIIDIAQLHGNEDNEYIKMLRKRTAKGIWQAIIVRNSDDLTKAEESQADLVLLDAGQGSGKAFNWDILSKLKRKFALAGGLNQENLEAAIKTNAVLLDVSGGVETDNCKDYIKIRKFISTVRK